MAFGYVAIIIFIAFSVFIPASLILSSMLLGSKKKQNKVSGLNFESAEASIGSRISIMSEYFHYFTGFLAFEVVVALVLAWAYVARGIQFTDNIYFLVMLLLCMILEVFVMLFALKRFWRVGEYFE